MSNLTPFFTDLIPTIFDLNTRNSQLFKEVTEMSKKFPEIVKTCFQHPFFLKYCIIKILNFFHFYLTFL